MLAVIWFRSFCYKNVCKIGRQLELPSWFLAKSNHPNVSPLSDLLPWGEMWLPEVRQLLQCPTPDTLLAINMDNWVFSSHQANSALFSDSTSSLHLRIYLKGKHAAKSCICKNACTWKNAAYSNVLILNYQTWKISVRCFTVCKSCLLPCLRNKLKLEVCFVQEGYKISWNYLCYKEQDKSFTVNLKPLCKTQERLSFVARKELKIK